MRMRKEIFESNAFTVMADEHLAMVNADFPRAKKNQLDKVKQAENSKLADKYNPDGKFPYTLLLDPSGKVLKAWDGLPSADSIQFTKQVAAICDAYKNH